MAAGRRPSFSAMTAPLILTLRFDDATFARLDAWRQRWFPNRGYRLPAHLTLFHHLPGAEIGAIGLHLHRLSHSFRYRAAGANNHGQLIHESHAV